ncbi:hypothetical protein B484DRAFT_319082, partial [Ochromonadaceae sp. CCMP2298]
MEYMEGEKREIEPLPPVDHSTIVYAPFTRCFYTEAPDVAAQTEEQAQQYLDELEVSISPANAPRAVHSFSQLGLNSILTKQIDLAGFKTPTPVQAQCLPCALAGRDVIGLAKTGSG